MNTKSIDGKIVDEADRFFVHRDIYRDPEIFELEMKHLFEGTWNLLGLESQIPKANDFITTHLGRAPIVISRDGTGKLHAFINSCRHKGAMVCHKSKGSARTFVCRYHGWVYSIDGKNIGVKDKEAGAYPPCFDQESHDLLPVPRFGNYRGFLFGSLNPDVPPLEESIAELRPFLDLIADQSPQGVECIPGQANFLYRANWKLQMENGVDPYHFTSTHPSYMQVLARRQSEGGSVYSSLDTNALERGTFSLGSGHNVMWGPIPSKNARPLTAVEDELKERIGPVRTKWMFYARNVTVFPNAQFAENASLQLRLWRPLAADLTEMTTYCIGPIGEAPEARKMRIRQYEEFFNASGLATPDDVANYEDSQRGFGARQVEWQQGHQRGFMKKTGAVPDAAKEIYVRPVSSAIGNFTMGDETVMHETYREWARLIRAGIEREARREQQ
jgi:benzoate/toluate 1,2-dioxygenase alpha subunit